MSAFRRTRAGIELRLRPGESAVLESLLAELVTMLAEEEPTDPLEAMVGSSGPRPSPDDPVLARLLPDAYDDPEAAAEYRGLMESELRAGKAGAARTVLAALERAGDGHVVLDDDEHVQAWLGALNDLRLALGTRYEVAEDTYELVDRLPPDDPRLPGLTAYLWLGWLQETLLEALTDE